jgi:hypothetical protein
MPAIGKKSWLGTRDETLAPSSDAHHIVRLSIGVECEGEAGYLLLQHSILFCEPLGLLFQLGAGRTSLSQRSVQLKNKFIQLLDLLILVGGRGGLGWLRVC